MRIGVDINEANVTNRVGSNQYAFEIIKSLYGFDAKTQYVLYGSSPLVADMPKERMNWHYKIIPPAKLWTQWRLPLELLKDRQNIDVFFTPGHYAPRWCPVPSVVTVMDLAFLFMSDHFKTKDYLQLKNWTKYSVKNARRIIAISESTKKDVVTQYGVSQKDVVIAYPGYSPMVQPKIKSKETVKPYILFVGTIQPRKNLVRLIKAFENIEDDIDLVLAGKQGWLADEVYETINKSNKKHAIKLLGYVKTAELPTLYTNSLCVVMPGMYEGFGIPALDAIHYGTIPVVANAGSLPEVVGESGLVFDPYSVESICWSLKNAIQLKDKERQEMLESLKKHASIFSWETSAKKIRKVLDEVTIS